MELVVVVRKRIFREFCGFFFFFDMFVKEGKESFNRRKKKSFMKFKIIEMVRFMLRD